jgi:hypothetical protein
MMHDDLMRRIDSYLAGNAPDLNGVTLVRECRTALALRTLQASLLEQRIEDLRAAHMRARIALQDLMTKHQDTLRYMHRDT